METTNKLTREEWAALFQVVAEFPPADEATLKDAAIGCPREIKLKIWQSLDADIKARLNQISGKTLSPVRTA